MSSTIPSTHTAWRVLRQGTPRGSVELQHDVTVRKELEDGEVLVKVKSAAMNPVGYKLMKLVPNFMTYRPLTAEYDFSGIVVDQKASRFKIGDEVYGQIPARGYDSKGQGALGQYLSINSKQLALKPPFLSFNEAAGLALAGRTAIDGLLDVAHIQRGQRIFINGGSSAVGIMAIQIAKTTGCHVVASCSTRNVELVRSLGADEVIDYTVTPPSEHFLTSPTDAFDAIFDAVGQPPSLFYNCEAYLKPDGIFVSTGPSTAGSQLSLGLLVDITRTFLQPTWLGGVRRTIRICRTWPDARAVPRLEKFVAQGKVKPVIDSVYKFSDVYSAYDRIMSGRAAGKVVVEVDV